MRTKLTTPI